MEANLNQKSPLFSVKPVEPIYFTKQQTYEYLCISRATLDRYVKKGILTAFKIGVGKNAKCFFKKIDIVEFIQRASNG